MAKGKTSIFFCQSCGYESSKWMGQCPGCKEWNTFVEEVVDKKSAGTLAKQKATASEAKVLPLSQIEMTYDKRVSTDMKELDRVLGGGVSGRRSRNRKIHIAASGVQESVGA